MKTIAVDIDGILTIERGGWDYESRTPNLENIEQVNFLYPFFKIILYSSRYTQDLAITKKWLEKYKVKYHKLILGKIYYDFLIDDKAGKDFNVINDYVDNYNFHKTCYRFKAGKVRKDEKHICYFCGSEILQNLPSCPKCGIIKCEHCGRCLCNISSKHKLLLLKIREDYCNNPKVFNSKGKIKFDYRPFDDLSKDMIKYSELAVNKCKEYYNENLSSGI